MFNSLASSQREAPGLIAANSPTSVLLDGGTHVVPLLVGAVPYLHVRLDGNVHIAYRRGQANTSLFSGRVVPRIGVGNVSTDLLNLDQGSLAILLNFTGNTSTEAKELSTLGFTFATHMVFSPQALAYLRRINQTPALALHWNFDGSALRSGGRVALLSRSTLTVSMLGSNLQPSVPDDHCHVDSSSSSSSFDPSNLFRLDTQQTSPVTRSSYAISEDDFWGEYDKNGEFPDPGQPIAEESLDGNRERKAIGAESGSQKLLWPCRKGASMVKRCCASLDEL